MQSRESIHIRDPLHGTLGVTPREIKLIDHPIFQRLRNIKQLGFADLAFPGATHTRYSHSMGAMHLATRLFDRVFASVDLPERVRDRFRQATRLAMLFHDVGHAPLSHTTEQLMPPVGELGLGRFAGDDVGRAASHEDYTLKMVLDSSLGETISAVFGPDGISPQDVAELIVGQSWTGTSLRFRHAGVDYAPVLRQMVSSECDADRMDYLQRDSFFSGVNYGKFDADWLIDNVAPVQDENVVYLQDARATRAGVTRALEAHLANSKPGELLVYYYTGHGGRTKAGATYLIPRDVKITDLKATAISVRSVVETIERSFRGDRVLLIADCCYSGALAEAAKARAGRISWACLTSSRASEVSTGQWTFTESVLAGLRGDPATDLNGDGSILLSELARFVEAELAFADGQLSTFLTTGARFPPHTQLAKATGKRPEGAVGQRIEVLWKGTWYRAKVRAQDPKKGTQVRYMGFGAEWDEWVGADRRRPYAPKAFPVGQSVEVEWKETWWPATVLAAKLGLHRIHYADFTDVWDEWVSPKRIRVREE
jgi:hypothetical protein